jgi:hypothetical protein
VARRALDKLDKNLLLDQGEILADVPFVRWEDGKPIFGAVRRGIITSHGCACEDYERAAKEAERSRKAGAVMIHVAPIAPATQYRDRQEAIARGEFLDYFFIFGEGSILKDHVLDLTREQAIPASVLAKCKKISRIADWQWKGLLVHIAVSRFHQQPEELFREELLESESDAA